MKERLGERYVVNSSVCACVCVCVSVCACACVRACMRACVRARASKVEEEEGVLKQTKKPAQNKHSNKLTTTTRTILVS